jgi:hypothetical protein
MVMRPAVCSITPLQGTFVCKTPGSLWISTGCIDATSKTSPSIPFAEAGREVAGAVWAEAAIEPATANSTAAEISLELMLKSTFSVRSALAC